MPVSFRRAGVALATPLLTLLLAAGCQQQEAISQYTIPKEPVPEVPPVPKPTTVSKSRTLGAMMTQGDKTWYFKLTGPSEAVTAQVEPFALFIQTVKFAEPADSTPEWKTPDGWVQEPGNDLRFATLKIPQDSDKPLELTVIPLPGDSTNDEFVLININRWRDQLGLPPVTLQTLYKSDSKTEEVHRLTINGKSVVLANFEGKLKPGGMGAAPFAR